MKFDLKVNLRSLFLTLWKGFVIILPISIQSYGKEVKTQTFHTWSKTSEDIKGHIRSSKNSLFLKNIISLKSDFIKFGKDANIICKDANFS